MSGRAQGEKGHVAGSATEDFRACRRTCQKTGGTVHVIVPISKEKGDIQDCGIIEASR